MAKRRKISIEYPVGRDDAAYVTFVGPNKARLETDPWSFIHTDDDNELKSLPDFQDLVELKKIGWRAKYRFVRVLERAQLQKFQFLLSETQAKAIEPVLSRVMELDGNWEQVFGGVLTIFLPRDCEYNPEKEITSLLGESGAK
jgi:hypothetical protein